MMRVALSGLLALALASPTAAQRPVAAENDLRCVAVISAIIGNVPEGEQRAQMVVGLMYFLGRAEGGSPGVNLKAELKRILPTLTNQIAADEAKRCGAILTVKGTELQEMGKELAATP